MRFWKTHTPRLPLTGIFSFSLLRSMSARVVFGCAAFGCLVSACSEDDSSTAPCELTGKPNVEFTRVELVADFSSPDCPAVSPQQINAELGDAGSELCSTTVNGCDLIVECDFELAKGGGTLKFKDKEFTGFVEVKDPIECAYAVTAVPR